MTQEQKQQYNQVLKSYNFSDEEISRLLPIILKKPEPEFIDLTKLKKSELIDMIYSLEKRLLETNQYYQAKNQITQ